MQCLKLKTKRIRKGYSCKEMAEMLNISKPYYSQIENGARRLRYDLAVKISIILNTRPDILFYAETIQSIVGEENNA